MFLRTSDLPGIGKRISFQTVEGPLIVLIVHNSGKKELHFFKDPEGDQADFSVNLTGEETRELAAQLLGITYQPTALDKMKAFKQEIVFEWIVVDPASQLANKTIAESRIRTRTGASVIGIIRADNIIVSPDIGEIIQPADTIIGVGKAEQIKALEALSRRE